MVGIVVPEICSAYKKYNKIISSIQSVFILQLCLEEFSLIQVINGLSTLFSTIQFVVSPQPPFCLLHLVLPFTFNLCFLPRVKRNVLTFSFSVRLIYLYVKIYNICLFMSRQPPVGQGLLNHEVSRSLTTTHQSRQDSSGQVISSLQRPLPDKTQQS